LIGDDLKRRKSTGGFRFGEEGEERRGVGMFVEELNLASPVVRVIAGSWDSMEGLRGQVALSDVVICHWLLWGTFPNFLK
jgi:hypothetical protein